MKKWFVFAACIVLVFIVFSCESVDKVTTPDDDTVSSAAKKGGGCATIQDGTIYDSNGDLITLGYDKYGYNYQAHLFNGLYDNYARPVPPVTECDTKLMMKWNDAWLSNKDCDGDGMLDRYYGFDSYIGSGAWLTNHMWGTNDDGTEWNYFVKIVAVPSDAVATDGIWYGADGVEIGPAIWGAFAIVQEVINDPSTGEHGAQYISPASPGLGTYKP